MVPADSYRISRVPHYSGAVCPVVLIFAYGAFTRSGRLFQNRSANHYDRDRRRSFNPRPAVTGRVWAPARSLATTCAITVVFFSSGYLDVSVHRVGPALGAVSDCSDGLPHSEIRALAGICPWARLIAACHVLLRLREPRHPSCALFSFPFFLGVTPFFAFAFRLF